MKNRKRERSTKMIFARVPEELFRRLEAASIDQDRPKSAIVRLGIRAMLAEHEAGKGLESASVAA